MSERILIVDDGHQATKQAERALRDAQIAKNLVIIDSLHSAGLPLDLATLFGAKPIAQKPEPPRQKTQADLDRIAAAEAKRARKAAKLRKGQP